MAWIAMFILVPVWGAASGLVIALIVKLLTKKPLQALAGIVVVSVVLHSAFMVEEMQWGVIRKYADSMVKRMAEENPQKNREASLGKGKLLYFAEGDDLQLNFLHQGQSSIGKAEILAMAEMWLKERGYSAKETELAFYGPVWRKGFFSVKIPGRITLICHLKDQPVVNRQTLESLYLELAYGKDRFSFIESAWVYSY